jgi:hypothetical protein
MKPKASATESHPAGQPCSSRHHGFLLALYRGVANLKEILLGGILVEKGFVRLDDLIVLG